MKVPTCFKNPDKPSCIDLLQIDPIYSNTTVFLKQASQTSMGFPWDLKMGCQKLKPKIIVYRDYKNFGNAKFRYDIVTITSNVDNFGMYKSTIFNIFNRHVPIKRKYVRPFMSKELHKVIMKRSRLRNIFLKNRINTNKKNYGTQRNLCKKLLKNTKKSYFENLDSKKITYNRSFWRTVLPLFTQNSSKGENINLVDDSKTISSDEELCETFNQFFFHVVPLGTYQKQVFFDGN